MNISDVVFRKASVQDAEDIYEYYKVVGGETNNNTFGPEGRYHDIDELKRELLRAEGEKKELRLLALLNDEIVGFGCLYSMPRRFSHRADMGITVKKKYWHNGIGTVLVEKLIRYAKNNDIEMIDLKVRTDNFYAIRIYHKFGFKSVGIIPAMCKNGDKYYDAEEMYLDLR